jgi:hypothetical protein
VSLEGLSHTALCKKVVLFGSSDIECAGSDTYYEAIVFTNAS